MSLAGEAAGPAFLEDYALLIAGLIDLYQADANPRWLREAIALQETGDLRGARQAYTADGVLFPNGGDSRMEEETSWVMTK